MREEWGLPLGPVTVAGAVFVNIMFLCGPLITNQKQRTATEGKAESTIEV
jgi:hypothetical protein